jgi:hypothetical protein
MATHLIQTQRGLIIYLPLPFYTIVRFTVKIIHFAKFSFTKLSIALVSEITPLVFCVAGLVKPNLTI